MTSLLSTVFAGPLKGPLNPVRGIVDGALGLNQPSPSTAPTVITPPPPDSGVVDQGAAAQAAGDTLRQRQGRAANLLTSSAGVNSTPVGTKTLLGQ